MVMVTVWKIPLLCFHVVSYQDSVLSADEDRDEDGDEDEDEDEDEDTKGLND